MNNKQKIKKIIGIILMVLGNIGYVVAIYYFACFVINYIGGQMHTNAAESEPYGLAGLAVVICFIFAAIAFTVASALFTPGIILYLSSKKPQQPTKQ